MNEYTIILTGRNINTKIAHVPTFEEAKNFKLDINKLTNKTLSIINGGDRVIRIDIEETKNPF